MLEIVTSPGHDKNMVALPRPRLYIREIYPGLHGRVLLGRCIRDGTVEFTVRRKRSSGNQLPDGEL